MENMIRHMVDSAKRLASGNPGDLPWVIKKSGVIVERCEDQSDAMQKLIEIQPHSVWEATRKDGYEIVLSTEDGDKVVNTFKSKYDDLGPEDDRLPISLGSNEYIRLKESKLTEDDKEFEKDSQPEIDQVKDPANPTPAECEEEEQDTVTKEYVGKTEDTHFYMVGTPGETDEVPADLQIVNQEGEKKYSAKENELDPADPANFIIQAIQELEIDEITRSVLIKYILPMLEEDEEPDEEEKPEGMEDETDTEKGETAGDENVEPTKFEKDNESKVNEDETYIPATKEEGGEYWRGQLIKHLEKMGNIITPEEKELLAKAKRESTGPVPESKVPDDKDPEATKIRKLLETFVKMGDDQFEVQLADDGTLDTVITINGQEYRFDQEFASMWRDEATGEMSKEGLIELALDALSNMEEDEYNEVLAADGVAAGDKNVAAKRAEMCDADMEDRRLGADRENESKVDEKKKLPDALKKNMFKKGSKGKKAGKCKETKVVESKVNEGDKKIEGLKCNTGTNLLRDLLGL